MIEREYDAEVLRPLLAEWEKEHHGDAFGLDMDMQTYIDDMNKWVAELGGVILTAAKERLVGFLTLVIVPSEFGKQMWALEKGWYSLPRERAGLGLYREAEKWAKEKGCSHLLMTAAHNASALHDKVCRFYARMNMKPFQTTYIKEIHNAGG